MERKDFEKRKRIVIKNGLSNIKALKETFEKLREINWYENWEYPNEYRKVNGTKLDPIDIDHLFDKIELIIFELTKFPRKLRLLWEVGLK